MSAKSARWLVLLLGLALLAAPAEARRRRSLPRFEWGLTAGVGAAYNDNLIGLSERDQNAYLNSAAGIPTPLESVDDLERELQIRPSFQWRAPFQTMVTGDYRFKQVNRLNNAFAHYQTHTFTVGVRPRVTGYRWAARVRVFGIPSFFLRVYRDRDYGEYHAARFSNWEYEGALRCRPLEPVWLEGKLARGSYYYNAKFTEYDSEYRDYTLSGTYDTPWRPLSLSAGYTRRLSGNVGKDQIGALTGIVPALQPGDDTEYGDSDFSEDELNMGANLALPWVRLVPAKAVVNYRLRRRVYTTGRPLELDPFHRGRLDRRGALTTALRADLTRALGAEAYFTYEARETESDREAVALTKDFIRREFGLLLSYQIR